MSEGIIAGSPETAAMYYAKGIRQQGYDFQALYAYLDAHSQPIYWRIRCKHPDGRKWIRPMHLGADGKYYLSEPPEFKDKPKPLYGLHLLAQYPQAMVWIVEGEKCADALNLFFEVQGITGQHIAITSGSDTSAESANWIPLRGRECRIWPDMDDGGIRYGNIVAGILKEYADTVAEIIDAAALELPEKGDCVNWLEAHPQATIDDLLALQTIQAVPPSWPDPKPIDSELLPVEPFDAAALLPDALKAWIMDSAERMPCPPDFIAAAVMAALGSVIGARCVIKPKRFDDWVVVPNLWGGIVGLPSAKKSPAINAAFKPMDRLIAKAMEDYETSKDTFETGKLVYEARESALEKQLNDAAKYEAKQQNEDSYDQGK